MGPEPFSPHKSQPAKLRLRAMASVRAGWWFPVPASPRIALAGRHPPPHPRRHPFITERGSLVSPTVPNRQQYYMQDANQLRTCLEFLGSLSALATFYCARVAACFFSAPRQSMHRPIRRLQVAPALAAATRVRPSRDTLLAHETLTNTCLLVWALLNGTPQPSQFASVASGCVSAQLLR